MSSVHELIELLQAELRNCPDLAERLEIHAELECAILEAAREARIDMGAVASEYARPG
jgi:hypothetical protein